MCGSKIPSVFGFVSMRQATESSAFALRSSMSTPPSAFEATLTTWRPAIVTVAGFVPCAVSGVRTFVRPWSPRSAW